MTILEKTRNYLATVNHRRLVVGLLTLLGVILAVFLIANLNNLLSLFGIRAALDDFTWKGATTMAVTRSHHASADVTINGTKYVYALGGVSKPGNSSSLTFSNSVERLKLKNDGSPDGNWQSVAAMNFGRADFKAIQAGNYLYAVAGHIATLPDNGQTIGLPFSTIERLDLSNQAASWELIANVMNVSFAPEVVVYQSELHIMGGIYGRPEHLNGYRGGGTGGVSGSVITNTPTLGGGSLTYNVPPVVGGDLDLVTTCAALKNTLIGQVAAGTKTAAEAHDAYAAAGCGEYNFGTVLGPADITTGMVDKILGPWSGRAYARLTPPDEDPYQPPYQDDNGQFVLTQDPVESFVSMVTGNSVWGSGPGYLHFFTTVDSYYVLKNPTAPKASLTWLANPTVKLVRDETLETLFTHSLSEMSSGSGDLKIDYYGIKLFGHRFGYNGSPDGNPNYNTRQYYYTPVLQGRVGHSVVEFEANSQSTGKDLTIVGGGIMASYTSWTVNSSGTQYYQQQDIAYVIEDRDIPDYHYLSPGGAYLSYPGHTILSLRKPSTTQYVWDRSNEVLNPSDQFKAHSLASNMKLPGAGQTGAGLGRAYHQVVAMPSPTKVDASGKALDELTVLGGFVNNPDLNNYPRNIFSLGWSQDPYAATSAIVLGTQAAGHNFPANSVASFTNQEGWQVTTVDANFTPRANFKAFMVGGNQILATGSEGDNFSSYYANSNPNADFMGVNKLTRGYYGAWEDITASYSGHAGGIDSKYTFPAFTLARQTSEGASIGTLVFTGGNLSNNDSADSVNATDWLGPMTLDPGLKGTPNASLSTVSADPLTLPADDTTQSVVTVTLKDINGDPVVGKFVALASDRQRRSGQPIVTIEPTSSVTDENGIAIFRVRSSVATPPSRPDKIEAFWGTSGSDAEAKATANNTSYKLAQAAALHFTPLLLNLNPSQGTQGHNFKQIELTGVSATGEGTHFTSGKTSVVFSRPEVFSVAVSKEMINANNSDRSGLTAKVQVGGVGQPGHSVHFSFESGSGALVVNNARAPQADVQTDSSGNAAIDMIAGTQAGSQKLKASVTISGTTYEQTFYVLQMPITGNVYDLEMSASPLTLSSAEGSTSQLTAKLTRGDLPVEGKTVTFIVVSGTDTLSSSSEITNAVGNVSTQFRVGANSVPGKVKIIAYVQEGSNFAPAIVTLTKTPPTGDNALVTSNVTVSGTTSLLFDLSIGANALVGGWDMQIITANVIDPLTGVTFTEIVSLPGYADFTVLSGSVGIGPRLISVVPNELTRGGQTTLTITGADTNFVQPGTQGGSVLYLRPAAGNNFPGDEQGLRYTEANFTVISPTVITVKVDASDQAKFGFWDVEVITTFGNQQELADLPGNQDLFVKVPNSGYFFDLTATPSTLEANGTNTSALAGLAGYFNNQRGNPQYTPLSGKLVSFTVTGGGAVTKASATTDTNGRLTNTYTVNTTSGIAIVSGSYNHLDQGSGQDIRVVGSASITKTLQSERVSFVLTANPTQIVLGGNSVTSELTATVLLDGQPVSTEVTFVKVAGTGSLAQDKANTNGQGKAVTTYVADAVVGQVRLKSTANIPGFGEAASNEATVTKVEAGGEVGNLDITVPLEGNHYDGAVAVYVKADNSTTPLLAKIGTLNASDKVTGLPNVELVSGVKYHIWVKAKNHLAAVKEFTGPASGTVSITFDALKIADITGTDTDDFAGFHDNDINSADFTAFASEFGKSGALVPDFNKDGKVNFADLVYMIKNFGKGSTKP